MRNNETDELHLALYAPVNPLELGFKGLTELLDLIESLDEEIRPDQMYLRRRLKYSRQSLEKHLHRVMAEGGAYFSLNRSHPPHVIIHLSFVAQLEEREPLFDLQLTLSPFDWLREPGRAESRANSLLSLVRSFAELFPVSYGYAHSNADCFMGSDPHLGDPFAPKRVYEAYWLNLYGPALVEHVGRQHLLATPAHRVEELSRGAVLWLTRPTPADFDSEPARQAQARALVHLRPELDLESTLSTLRQRSLAFVPLAPAFHPDVADILSLALQYVDFFKRRATIERFNLYQPPPVSEWLPRSQAPTPNVPDSSASIQEYEALFSEQLIALLHTELPSVFDLSPASLPHIDHYLWYQSWGSWLSAEQKERLIPALGAYLGRLLVHTLGGRWVPRLDLDEACVLIGERAWLPFLRARHALQDKEAPLNSSLTQLFLEARRQRAQAA